MASGLRPAVGFAPESDLGAPRDVPPSNVPLDDPGGVRRHVHQLESQKEFLRTYAARLEAELRAYQTRFPDLTVAVDNDSDDLPPWIANAEYLSPLLLAYDAQIAQADALAADLKRELLAVKDDAKKMAKRNEELENELEHHIGKLLRRFDADSNWSGADGEEVGELNQRCALLGDENQMLRAQEAETRRELDDARVDVRDRDDLIMGLRNEVADLQATCAKVPDLSAQVDALEQELTMTRSQTETALGHMKSAQEQLLTTQVELQARARDADQFRQLLSEHDADSERCIAELRAELVRLNQMYTSAAGRVSDLERQLQDSTERERVFSRDVQVKQADLHGMLATIESLEKTMQDLQKTNATIGAELTSAKSDLEDARLARDEAVHRADGLAKQKQSLEDRMDLEITSYRDDANAATAKALETSRAKLDAMHAELRDLELARTSAENAKAKAERDAKSARAASVAGRRRCMDPSTPSSTYVGTTSYGRRQPPSRNAMPTR
ncbi:hypothetical protein PBRA_002074 [Plasmodiophora brassicae]|uniref:Uncharacterized protein n=1 Tax=Plasmodiophora brassicae TaxID=37360 RepID=A0A0G4J1E6_PLABS|nr:hypothetical protein PBRA_002074 [Plasmodiophora brassicae]